MRKLCVCTATETRQPGMKPNWVVTIAYAIQGGCTAAPSNQPHQRLVPADQRARTWRPVSSHGQNARAPSRTGTPHAVATTKVERARLQIVADRRTLLRPAPSVRVEDPVSCR